MCGYHGYDDLLVRPVFDAEEAARLLSDAAFPLDAPLLFPPEPNYTFDESLADAAVRGAGRAQG